MKGINKMILFFQENIAINFRGEFSVVFKNMTSHLKLWTLLTEGSKKPHLLLL